MKYGCDMWHRIICHEDVAHYEVPTSSSIQQLADAHGRTPYQEAFGHKLLGISAHAAVLTRFQKLKVPVQSMHETSTGCFIQVSFHTCSIRIRPLHEEESSSCVMSQPGRHSDLHCTVLISSWNTWSAGRLSKMIVREGAAQ